MIVQMFVINRVEQRVFQHIEKIRNLKHKNTVGLKHVTYTGDDAAEIIDMGANIVGRDNFGLAAFCRYRLGRRLREKINDRRDTSSICFRCDFCAGSTPWISHLSFEKPVRAFRRLNRYQRKVAGLAPKSTIAPLSKFQNARQNLENP